MYSKDSHIELITRSQPFLEHLVKHNMLSPEAAGYLFEISCRMDEASRNALLKILGETTIVMESRVLEVLADAVLAAPESSLEENHLELLYQLSRHSIRSRGFISRVIRFLWQLSSKGSRLMKKATNTLLGLNVEDRGEIINLCAENLLTTETPNNQITILSKLMQNCSQADVEQVAVSVLDKGLGTGLMRFVSPDSDNTANVLDFLSMLHSKAMRHFSPQAIYEKLGLCEKLINWVSKQYLHWT